jgi:S-adenosylmethionine hydrolase
LASAYALRVAIVTLLTDFGDADTYVGQMKGAILAISPTATLVDLTHSVAPQDIRSGAFLLWTAVEAFPAGSIHLAVVDPGVGSERRAVAAQSARGDLFVGPDNGLLVLGLERLGGMRVGVELSNSRFWGPRSSKTFHGRDVFGPVAGYLVRGVQLSELGPRIYELRHAFSLPRPIAAGSILRGEVLHVDRFGTLVTNLPGDTVAAEFSLTIKGRRVAGHRQARFESVPEKSLIAFVGSTGLIEIAIRNGSAAFELHAAPGEHVAAEPAELAQASN